MKAQNYELENRKILDAFLNLKTKKPNRLKNRLKLSWSNWGFGMESLGGTTRRLNKHDIKYIELHGNRYGDDLGYRSSEVKKILLDYDIEVVLLKFFGPDCNPGMPEKEGL